MAISVDLTHEFIAQYRHSFSERFGINLAEDFRYFTDPSIIESIGTNFRDGAYYANTINASFSAQWTPLFSTLTTYANTVIKYENSAIALEQDSMENTGSQSFSFAILPKINFVVGGIVDNVSYDDISRQGYTSYTGFDTGLELAGSSLFVPRWTRRAENSVTRVGLHEGQSQVRVCRLTHPLA